MFPPLFCIIPRFSNSDFAKTFAKTLLPTTKNFSYFLFSFQMFNFFLTKQLHTIPPLGKQTQQLFNRPPLCLYAKFRRNKISEKYFPVAFPFPQTVGTIRVQAYLINFISPENAKQCSRNFFIKLYQALFAQKYPFSTLFSPGKIIRIIFHFFLCFSFFSCLIIYNEHATYVSKYLKKK